MFIEKPVILVNNFKTGKICTLNAYHIYTISIARQSENFIHISFFNFSTFITHSPLPSTFIFYIELLASHVKFILKCIILNINVLTILCVKRKKKLHNL